MLDVFELKQFIKKHPQFKDLIVNQYIISLIYNFDLDLSYDLNPHLTIKNEANSIVEKVKQNLNEVIAYEDVLLAWTTILYTTKD